MDMTASHVFNCKENVVPKMAFLNENPYEKAFFSTMLALKKALKGKK